MPSFKPQPKKSSLPAVAKKNVPRVTVPQCHVCASPHRDWIEEMIVRQTPYIQISRMLEGAGISVDRRSISWHGKEHLQWERAAIQRIASEEAIKDDQKIEEGVSEIAAHRVYLRTALHKGFEGLLTGDVPVTVKEALGVIDKLDEYEGRITGAKLDRIKVQFDAISQAMREIVPPEFLLQVLNRATELIEGSAIEITDQKELEDGGNDE